MFLTCSHDRLLPTGGAQLTGLNPGPLRAAENIYRRAIETSPAISDWRPEREPDPNTPDLTQTHGPPRRAF